MRFNEVSRVFGHDHVRVDEWSPIVIPIITLVVDSFNGVINRCVATSKQLPVVCCRSSFLRKNILQSGQQLCHYLVIFLQQ